MYLLVCFRKFSTRHLGVFAELHRSKRVKPATGGGKASQETSKPFCAEMKHFSFFSPVPAFVSGAGVPSDGAAMPGRSLPSAVPFNDSRRERLRPWFKGGEHKHARPEAPLSRV